MSYEAYFVEQQSAHEFRLKVTKHGNPVATLDNYFGRVEFSIQGVDYHITQSFNGNNQLNEVKMIRTADSNIIIRAKSFIGHPMCNWSTACITVKDEECYELIVFHRGNKRSDLHRRRDCELVATIHESRLRDGLLKEAAPDSGASTNLVSFCTALVTIIWQHI